MIHPYSNQRSIFTPEQELIQSGQGKVWLVGFGPGDPELLTMKGFKLLQLCDIIFFDDLLNKTFLQQFRAKKVYVGKRRKKHSIEQESINKLLLESALEGKTVVRLKGGDPMLFAHGGEEIKFLKQHGIRVEVIPGITAAMAASAASQIPLTHRGIASSVTFITGHSDKDVKLPETGTIVIYMGAMHIQKIAQNAIDNGRNRLTPVLLMYNISNPEQEEYITNLHDLAVSQRPYQTPLLIIIGEVVSLKSKIMEELIKYEWIKNLPATI